MNNNLWIPVINIVNILDLLTTLAYTRVHGWGAEGNLLMRYAVAHGLTIPACLFKLGLVAGMSYACFRWKKPVYLSLATAILTFAVINNIFALVLV